MSGKPWVVHQESPFQVKNPIFLSPKPVIYQSPKEPDNAVRVLFPPPPMSLTPVPKKSAPVIHKTDLNLDSPQSKFKYKQFLRDIKEMDGQPFLAQLKQSFKQLPALPGKIHWRVLLDLADLAKRDSQMVYATRLFKVATSLQPYAYQGWLEWAKLCEESGDIK